MIVFYWIMAVLIGGTFLPSAMYLVLYVATGEDPCLHRARAMWNFTKALTLFGTNVLIWGHVIAGLWQIWFH